MGMAAAVALASVLYFQSIFCSKMPLIGHIFEQVENNTSVKRRFQSGCRNSDTVHRKHSRSESGQNSKNADSKNGNTGIDDDSEVPADGPYTKTSMALL